MNKIRHGVAALVIFAFIISIFIFTYDGLEENYNITKGDVKTMNITTINGTKEQHSGNIVDQFKEMNLIEGISQIESGIAKLSPGSASNFDILGGIAAVGVGALKSIFGLLTAPYSIVRIILGYYAGDIIGMIGGLVVLVGVYVGFILLSAYLKEQV